MQSSEGSDHGLADIGNGAKGGSGGTTDDAVPWKDRIQRSSAISRKIRGGNYVQIATVDGEGKPRCRTVVFRGFLDPFAGNKERAGGEVAMRMITDARSEKVAHASAQPACEMVWWFTKSSEQYRISGDLQFVGGADGSGGGDGDDMELARELQNARKSQWGSLSDMAREQFYWAQPGIDHEPAAASPPAGGRDQEGKILPPPDTFLLMLLWPKQVKYLRLTDNFAQIDALDEKGGAWTARRVNP